jgi:hypothetical protein
MSKLTISDPDLKLEAGVGGSALKKRGWLSARKKRSMAQRISNGNRVARSRRP